MSWKVRQAETATRTTFILDTIAELGWLRRDTKTPLIQGYKGDIGIFMHVVLELAGCSKVGVNFLAFKQQREGRKLVGKLPDEKCF